MFPAERIVCLTEETTELIYLLGEERRIVGISGYTVRPPRARKEKPRVSAFISADIPKILVLELDLVLAFSEMQADIVAGLIRAGVAVHAFNQRSIAEILDMIRMVGCFVGAAENAHALAEELSANLDGVRAEASARSIRRAGGVSPRREPRAIASFLRGLTPPARQVNARSNPSAPLVQPRLHHLAGQLGHIDGGEGSH